MQAPKDPDTTDSGSPRTLYKSGNATFMTVVEFLVVLEGVTLRALRLLNMCDRTICANKYMLSGSHIDR